MPKLIYDLETYRELFLFVCTFEGSNQYAVYECSRRRNDARYIVALVRNTPGLVMVGFNNLRFDYPIVHWLVGAVESGEADQLGGAGIALRAHELANAIIASGRDPEADRDAFTVWPRHQLAPQMDLMRIHHLNNRARATSLKALQVAMRSPSIVDMPIDPAASLTDADMNTVIHYGVHDVQETARFLALSADAVAFREYLGPDYYATSDAGIGKKFIKRVLEEREPGCTARQTWREKVALKDIILPGIAFQRRPFAEMLENFRTIEVNALSVKSSFPETKVFEAGLIFKFGLGGLHGSRTKTTYAASDTHEIVDVDVTSYYPTLSIANHLAPEHLRSCFTDVYRELFDMRMKYTKDDPNYRVLKFGLNGVFGDSGSVYSPFLDVAFLLAITVNGQLLICMLAEPLSAIPGVEIIQVNTDGLTLYAPRARRPEIDAVLQWWQAGTRLKLEETQYRKVWLRDVNNYMAQRADGKMKRKGAYEWKYEWWQDPSATVIAKAAEDCLLTGRPVMGALRDQLQADPWSFLLRARAKGRDRLEYGGLPVQKTCRYYLSTSGAPLVKVMPPLPGKEDVRRTDQQKGRLVRLANVYNGEPLIDPDLDWYAKEVSKLVKGVNA